MRRLMAMSTFILLAGSMVLAQDATTAPTTQAVTLDPTDNAAATAAEGKSVVVEGTITKAAWGKSGKIMQARFAKGKDSLVLVIFAKNKDDMDKAFNGDVAAALKGATVRATGEVKDYRGRPEIIIDNASQLTILSPAATQATTQPYDVI